MSTFSVVAGQGPLFLAQGGLEFWPGFLGSGISDGKSVLPNRYASRYAASRGQPRVLSETLQNVAQVGLCFSRASLAMCCVVLVLSVAMAAVFQGLCCVGQEALLVMTELCSSGFSGFCDASPLSSRVISRETERTTETHASCV